jgi:hypothetical protein
MGGPGVSQNVEELVIAEWVARPPTRPRNDGALPESLW